MDERTVTAFGDEWSRFDQTHADADELRRTFERYFAIFPWSSLPPDAIGVDIGCGSGRWAQFVAPRVRRLDCIDPSEQALSVAKRNLAHHPNIEFLRAPAESVPLPPASQDFGYALGVLHHTQDTEGAMRACANLMKPGAPFLVYLYYRFDNRPMWFRWIWKMSEIFRFLISRLPPDVKAAATDTIAFLVYWPLARLSLAGERFGLNMRNMPLHFYRNATVYMMRTDCRDRFGTPLERRFTRGEIERMMARSGFAQIQFASNEPYWVALGVKQ